MRRVIAGFAALLMLAVVAQFFFAATGAFDSAPKDESFQVHRALGYVIFLLAVVLTIVAALARMPGRLIGMSGLVAGLTVVQVVIALLANAFGDGTAAGPLVFGLHALNGLAIMGVVATVLRQARQLSNSPTPDGTRDDAGVSGPAAGSAQPAS